MVVWMGFETGVGSGYRKSCIYRSGAIATGGCAWYLIEKVISRP